jgi:hypothetical protein
MAPKVPAQAEEPAEEEAPEALPAKETPPSEDDQVREIMMNRAGLK